MLLCMRNKKLVGSSQHGFTEGISCLIYPIAFSGVADTVDKGRALDVLYLNASKIFDTVSHSLFITKFVRYGIHRWKVRREDT